MSKIQLTLNAVNGGAFHRLPAREIELEAERVICNDIRFPWESHPYNLQLWVIGSEFGALGAVWANCEQDALDELVDKGLGESLLVDAADESEDDAHLGNAGEACDLTNVWMQTVRFTAEDYKLIAQFAEARGSNSDNLDN